MRQDRGTVPADARLTLGRLEIGAAWQDPHPKGDRLEVHVRGWHRNGRMAGASKEQG